MDMLSYRKNSMTAACLAVGAMAVALWPTTTAASPAEIASAEMVAQAAMGQFNFGLRGNQDASSADTPSQRAIPRLLGGRGTDDSTAARPDPFQLGDRESAVERLTSSGKSQAKSYLDKGRAALAQRDLAGAEGWYHKAVAVDARFDRGEYSPAQLKEDRFFHRMLAFDKRLVLVGGASMQYGKRLGLEEVRLGNLK